MSGSEGGPGPDGQSAQEIAELVRSIATVMHQADVSELDLDVGSLKLRLRRPLSMSNGITEPIPRFEASSDLDRDDEHLITAPMIGTYYASPTPGTAPFVVVGDAVQSGQPVGIIEAMKIMNEISADRSGVVEAVLVENGQPVEYGTPLLRLAVGTVTGA
jgi:acetyl-CoA carboxylase biotin carboxyl carrier protein